MSWGAILAADIRFEHGTIDAWKALAIDDASYEEWGPVTEAAPPGVAATVRESLVRVDEMSRGCAALGGTDQLALTWEGSTLRVRGYLNEDDYRSIARDLATVLRVAERVGARGQYIVLAVLSGAATEPDGVDYAIVVNEIVASIQSAMAHPPEKPVAKKKAPAAKKPVAKKKARAAQKPVAKKK